jgi:hypothetical protein
LRTFDEIAELLEQQAGAYPKDNIELLLCGWQTHGYDHAHPAAVPPCPEAGGWAGMKRIGDTAKKLGILFGVHEQYRDFFLSSPFFSEDLTRKDARRDSPRHFYWSGGTQSILCPKLMLDFVKRSVRQLIDHGIALNSAYQDVLACIPLEECYDHRHPVNRSECLDARMDVFRYYRDLGWLIRSENALDWSVPLLDSIHVHWPEMLADQDGKLPGIPVPLFSLVFHDAAILLSLPKRTPTLFNALCGSNNYRPEDTLLRQLHKETAYLPMTSHQLLSEDGMSQESVFGDRIEVRVDLAKEGYEIGGLKKRAAGGKLRNGFMQ